MKAQDHPFTSDEILGREAVDPEGEILGSVTKLHIDRDGKELTGLTIDQGLFQPDLFVGLDFVDRFGVDAVFLNRIPLEKYIGKKVLRPDGSSLGRVAEINRRQFDLVSLSVRPRGLFSWKKRIVVEASDIKEISSVVFLKRPY